MKDRAISLNAVRDILKMASFEEFDIVAYHNIMQLPPVTPQPKKGQWIKSNIGGAKVCSVCNAHMGLSNFKYCPSCGADMRGDDDEQTTD